MVTWWIVVFLCSVNHRCHLVGVYVMFCGPHSVQHLVIVVIFLMFLIFLSHHVAFAAIQCLPPPEVENTDTGGVDLPDIDPSGKYNYSQQATYTCKMFNGDQYR